MPRFLTSLLALLAIAILASVSAAEELSIERIEIAPPAVLLVAKRDYAQLMVTGFLPGGEAIDLTHEVKWESQDPKIAGVEKACCLPKANGKTVLTARVGELSATATVEVRGMERPDPIRFHGEVLAALTKQGCNAGSCHGSPEGKGGFALSMLAYKPAIDEESLVQGGLTRRIEPLAPLESLLIKKPLLRVTHVGGKKLHPTDAAYDILVNWIGEGANLDSEKTPHCVGIEVSPRSSRLLRAPHLTQQLAVRAKMSDGTLRNVTHLATYSTSNVEVAAPNANGLVTGRARGQAAVAVRYLDFVQAVNLTVVHPIEGFAEAWNNPPEYNYIDKHVNRKLRELQFLPGELCDDATFVRRVHLDLTGLLATADRVREFLADKAADKRTHLIDELLATEEFARFWALKEADLLRVSPTLLKDGRAELFHDWLVESFKKNQPFDAYVREILTATGDTRQVAPANYFQAIATTDDLAETTAQLFMGSRINCAKCHNHPFENWTQDDYYRIAAVFSRVKKEKELVMLMDQGEARHPATGQVMKPWGAPGREGEIPPASDRRSLFVDWLVKPGNPLFARVEANRIWAHLMGRGIIHPVDDFRSSNPPANPELLDALAADFEAQRFDRKHLVRTICNSHTYQRSSTAHKLNADDATLFSHVIPRRLTAEQLHDAVGFASRTLAPVKSLAAEFAAAEKRVEDRRAALPEGANPKEDAELKNLQANLVTLKRRPNYHTQRPVPERSQFAEAFGLPKRESPCACERSTDPTLDQALVLLNGNETTQAALAGAGRYAEFADDARLILELCLSAYGRSPTDRELRQMSEHLAKSPTRRDAVADVLWAVLNTREFLFQH